MPSEAIRNKIKVLYSKPYNKSLREIGDITGYSHETIRQCLGDDVRKLNKMQATPERALQVWRSMRYDCEKAAAKLNVTRQNIYRIVEKFGTAHDKAIREKQKRR